VAVEDTAIHFLQDVSEGTDAESQTPSRAASTTYSCKRRKFGVKAVGVNLAWRTLPIAVDPNAKEPATNSGRSRSNTIRKSITGANSVGRVDWPVVNRSTDTWSCVLISAWVVSVALTNGFP